MREKIVECINKRVPLECGFKQESVVFGENSLSLEKMGEFLTKEEFERVKESMRGEKHMLNMSLAERVAMIMKDWAIKKGATHFTHWFQPLSGRTAEKHDAFLDVMPFSEAIFILSAEKLIQQEPDASSFPNGGSRNTFEARGYTAWDPTSPAFVLDKTLYIPSVFISLNGESLDYKTPLLRSLTAINSAAKAMAGLFVKDVKSVQSVMGWEQEYFLIDKSVIESRLDIMITGRAVFGEKAPKSQDFLGNYFSAIPKRVLSFMMDVEFECNRVGIPVKTRHNEVAPNQYEFAHIFEEMNIAVDHNLLFMNILQNVALKHNLVALLHEKPFGGINGSGKHCNWSIMRDGRNVFDPTGKKVSKIEFLMFLVNTVAAIKKYGSLLAISTASASNDRRLGGHEAPPSIISVFLGEHLTKILDTMSTDSDNIENTIHILDRIPAIISDGCDRNRTSPFAFNINKFEFRMIGSSENCARPMITLNTICAKQFNEFIKMVKELKKSHPKLSTEEIVLMALKKELKESRDIIFNGDGYSKEWPKEALKRGLHEIKNTVDALEIEMKPEFIELFEETKVLNKQEYISRNLSFLKNYTDTIGVEVKIVKEVVLTMIIPSVIEYQTKLMENYNLYKKMGSLEENSPMLSKNLEESLTVSISEKSELLFASSASSQASKGKLINLCESFISKLLNYVSELESKENLKDLSLQDKARKMVLETVPLIKEIVKMVDSLEEMVDDKIWRMLKLREIYFAK